LLEHTSVGPFVPFVDGFAHWDDFVAATGLLHTCVQLQSLLDVHAAPGSTLLQAPA
jgi:hypothetical protein